MRMIETGIKEETRQGMMSKKRQTVTSGKMLVFAEEKWEDRNIIGKKSDDEMTGR